jgi:hypothetical protein
VLEPEQSVVVGDQSDRDDFIDVRDGEVVDQVHAVKHEVGLRDG